MSFIKNILGFKSRADLLELCAEFWAWNLEEEKFFGRYDFDFPEKFKNQDKTFDMIVPFIRGIANKYKIERDRVNILHEVITKHLETIKNLQDELELQNTQLVDKSLIGSYEPSNNDKWRHNFNIIRTRNDKYFVARVGDKYTVYIRDKKRKYTGESRVGVVTDINYGKGLRTQRVGGKCYGSDPTLWTCILTTEKAQLKLGRMDIGGKSTRGHYLGYKDVVKLGDESPFTDE